MGSAEGTARISAASETRRVPQARRFCGAEHSKAARAIDAQIVSKTTHSN
jgi:hypothetical protein